MFYFHPDPWGFMIQFDLRILYFSKGLVQPPTSYSDVISLGKKTTLYLGLSPLPVTVANEGFPTKNVMSSWW